MSSEIFKIPNTFMLVRRTSACNLARLLVSSLPPMTAIPGTTALPVAQDDALFRVPVLTPLDVASAMSACADSHLAPTRRASLYSASCATHQHSAACYAIQLPPAWANHIRCVAAYILMKHPKLSVRGCVRVFKAIMEQNCFASSAAYVDQLFAHPFLGPFTKYILDRSMVRPAQVWAADIGRDIRETRGLVTVTKHSALEKEKVLYSEWSGLYDTWKCDGVDGLLDILWLEFIAHRENEDVLTFAAFYGLVSCITEPCLAIIATFAGLWHLQNCSGEMMLETRLPYMWYGISRLQQDGLTRIAESDELVHKLVSFDWSGLRSGSFDREAFTAHIGSNFALDVTWATFRAIQLGMTFHCQVEQQEANEQLEQLEQLVRRYRHATNSLAFRAMELVCPSWSCDMAQKLEKTGGCFTRMSTDLGPYRGCFVLERLWKREPLFSGVEALKLIVEEKFPRELLEKASEAPMSCQKILAAIVTTQLYRILDVELMELNLNDLLHTTLDCDPFAFSKTVSQGLSAPTKDVPMHEATVTHAVRRIFKTGEDYSEKPSNRPTSYIDSLTLAAVALELAAMCVLCPEARRELTTLTKRVKWLLDAGVEARQPFATPCTTFAKGRDRAADAVNSHALTCSHCKRGTTCQQRLVLQRHVERQERLIRERMQTTAAASRTETTAAPTKQSLNIPCSKQEIRAPRLPTVTRLARPVPMQKRREVSQVYRVPVGNLSVERCSFDGDSS